MNILSIYIGYIIDLIIGDPYSFPHPVRFIGKLIKITEDRIRKVAKNDKALKIGGFILWFITVGVTYFVTYLIVKLSSLIPGGFLIANSFLIYTTLATKCLKDEAVKIYEVLKTKDIEKASYIQMLKRLAQDII